MSDPTKDFSLTQLALSLALASSAVSLCRYPSVLHSGNMYVGLLEHYPHHSHRSRRCHTERVWARWAQWNFTLCRFCMSQMEGECETRRGATWRLQKAPPSCKCMKKLRDMPSAGSGLSASRARRDNETERQLEKLEKLWQLAIRQGCHYVELGTSFAFVSY